MKATLPVLFLAACSASYAKPSDLACVLANTTDLAVSEYILSTPESAMPVTADYLLEVDERMIEIARLGGNGCLVARDARAVADAIKCGPCLKLVEQLEGEEKCRR
jgi:hypothetical protein